MLVAGLSEPNGELEKRRRTDSYLGSSRVLPDRSRPKVRLNPLNSETYTFQVGPLPGTFMPHNVLYEPLVLSRQTSILSVVIPAFYRGRGTGFLQLGLEKEWSASGGQALAALDRVARSSFS